ncbi:MAG: hypothetical protein AAGD43_06710 [Pseudomonadota bacterium]
MTDPKMQRSHGLGYSLDTPENSHLLNIDQLASENPTDRAIARLNRNLINVIDVWLKDEIALHTHPVDVAMAIHHGITSIVGTALLAAPPNLRGEMHQAMRDHLLAVYDAMGKAIIDQETDV